VGGWLVVTPNESWEERWNTPEGTTPYFDEADTVAEGERVYILTFIGNPGKSSNGDVNVTCDIEVQRPDGTYSQQLKKRRVPKKPCRGTSEQPVSVEPGSRLCRRGKRSTRQVDCSDNAPGQRPPRESPVGDKFFVAMNGICMPSPIRQATKSSVSGRKRLPGPKTSAPNARRSWRSPRPARST
jgi:hypothetical protein